MKKRSLLGAFLSFFLCALCIVPFAYVLYSSFQTAQGDLTLKYYYQVFVGQTQYLFQFWKSVGMSLLIALAQVFVSVLAAYGFARFPGKLKAIEIVATKAIK